MSSYSVLSARTLKLLGDASGVKYGTDLLTEAYLQAIEDLSEAFPQICTTTHTVSVAGRVQTLTAAGLMYITELIYPYSSTSNEDQPAHSEYFLYWVSQAPTLYVGGASVPQVGEKINVVYAAYQTLNGLDGASKTTLPAHLYSMLVLGAAVNAAYYRAAALFESSGGMSQDYQQLMGWAEKLNRDWLGALESLKKQQHGARQAMPRQSQGWALDEEDGAYGT
jgi:hypothetical protein